MFKDAMKWFNQKKYDFALAKAGEEAFVHLRGGGVLKLGKFLKIHYKLRVVI